MRDASARRLRFRLSFLTSEDREVTQVNGVVARSTVRENTRKRNVSHGNDNLRAGNDKKSATGAGPRAKCSSSASFRPTNSPVISRGSSRLVRPLIFVGTAPALVPTQVARQRRGPAQQGDERHEDHARVARHVPRGDQDPREGSACRRAY